MYKRKNWLMERGEDGGDSSSDSDEDSDELPSEDDSDVERAPAPRHAGRRTLPAKLKPSDDEDDDEDDEGDDDSAADKAEASGSDEDDEDDEDGDGSDDDNDGLPAWMRMGGEADGTELDARRALMSGLRDDSDSGDEAAGERMAGMVDDRAMLRTLLGNWLDDGIPDDEKRAGGALKSTLTGSLILNAKALRTHLSSKRVKKALKAAGGGKPEDFIEWAMHLHSGKEDVETHAERLARLKKLAAKAEDKGAKHRAHKKHKKSKPGKRQRLAMKEAAAAAAK